MQRIESKEGRVQGQREEDRVQRADSGEDREGSVQKEERTKYRKCREQKGTRTELRERVCNFLW